MKIMMINMCRTESREPVMWARWCGITIHMHPHIIHT